MSRHDDTLSLRHMLDHAREAVRMAAGRQRADLDNDRQFSLAMTRLLEIIGEAAGRVPEKTREHIDAIPWPKVVGLRNRLIHGYDVVDFDVLWKVVRNDLSPLIDALHAYLIKIPDRPGE